jgi:drug/metabolite transporter (DMT)-like permease
MQIRIWAALLGAAAGWGTTGVATRAALDAGVPPVAMVTIRSAIAAALLLAVLLIRSKPITRDPQRWLTGTVMATFQLSLPFVLFTLAYQYASAGFVGMLVALIPLATAVIANFVLPDEPLTTVKTVGLSIAFAGVGFLLLSGDSGLAEGGRPLLAAVLSLGAILSIAGSSIFAKGRADTYEPMELTWMQFTIGAVLLVIVMVIFEGIPTELSAWGWALVVYLTIIGSLIPFILYYWLLSQVSATKASLVGYVVPLVALGTGVVLLDERIQFGIVVGGTLILAGVILTDRSEKRRAKAAELTASS